MTESSSVRPGRNEPCHCGSGKKYKRCCLNTDAVADREAREAAAAAAPAPVVEEDAPQEKPGTSVPHGRGSAQPWRRNQAPSTSPRGKSGPRTRGGI